MSLDFRIFLGIEGEDDIYLHLEAENEIDLFPILDGFFLSVEAAVLNNKKNLCELSNYSRVKNNDECIGKECIICTDEFKLHQGKRILKCEHVYHKKCIDKWLRKYKNNCPLCRQSV